MSNISTGNTYFNHDDPIVKIARGIMESTISQPTTIGQPADKVSDASSQKVIGKPSPGDDEIEINPVIPTYQPNHTTVDGNGDDVGAGLTKPQQ